MEHIAHENLDSSACDRVSRWLEERPLVDGFYALSPDRSYSHDECEYDNQYSIANAELGWGEGLMNLLRQRGADMSAPCLEIGCGTGALTLGLAAATEYPSVVATDMSSSFLRIVQNKSRALSIPPNRLYLAIYDSDAPDTLLPPTGAFSLIAMRAVLHHVLEPEAFIHKMAALLKPGGVMALHEPCREGMMLLGLFARMYEMSLIRASVRNNPSASPHNTNRKIADAQLVANAMLYYSRRDIDKSAMEDKHLFQPEEVLIWGQRAGLETEFLPNLEFNSFKHAGTEPGAFSLRHYISSYLRYCMSLTENVVKEYMSSAAPYIHYIEQCSQGGCAPAFHGIFLLRKPL